MTSHQFGDDLTVHQLELSVSNVYVVEGPNGAILVDAGDPKQEDEILDGIDEAGVDRALIGAIVITHAHADHTGSARALSEALDVPVLLQREDAARAAKGKNPRLPPQNLTAVFLKWFLKSKYPAYEADEPFQRCVDLGPYGVKGRVRLVGGHTVGSSIIELDHGAVVVGDLLAGGFLGGAIAPKNPESHYFHEDREVVRATIEHIASSGATVMFVGHGGPLDVARVQRELETREFGKPGEQPWRMPSCEHMRTR